MVSLDNIHHLEVTEFQLVYHLSFLPKQGSGFKPYKETTPFKGTYKQTRKPSMFYNRKHSLLLKLATKEIEQLQLITLLLLVGTSSTTFMRKPWDPRTLWYEWHRRPHTAPQNTVTMTLLTFFDARLPKGTHCLNCFSVFDLLWCIHVLSTVTEWRKNLCGLRLNIAKHCFEMITRLRL